VEFDKVYLAH